MKSNMPVRYSVGDKVIITEDTLKIMKNSNRSCVTPNYPTMGYISMAESCLDVIGEVIQAFEPGYEVTVKFGDNFFHMKDNWIEKV